ncbi:MAG: RdgB/HAM1 family non-canonical purine NTP pyrophosphatase [Verrucomicrobiota bacterium]|nr:RdgB/HAM1 family non-canonical purine NTP pyrophosphatase [Verrucomicrobiota bacterium]
MLNRITELLPVHKMHELFLATRNPHKTRELGQILGPGFALEDLRRRPDLGEVIEDGTTFLENARLKAVTISQQVAGLVVADDSGLEVDSLGGAPGVCSARYAGEGATDEANRRRLLEELNRLPGGSSRAARFRCVLVLARDGDVLATFDGAVTGQILGAERGDAGFGYDPLFQPDGFERSCAELRPEEKNAISHRAVAAAKLRIFLRSTGSAPD